LEGKTIKDTKLNMAKLWAYKYLYKVAINGTQLHGLVSENWVTE
jgi:hypothetical protein